MKNKLLLFVLAILQWSSLMAQVTVEATIDSAQILIGEQARISLEVSLDAGKRLQLPLFNDTIVRGIEVLEVAKPDTQYINGNKRMLIKERYTITSFDSALYYIPPIEVAVDDEVYKSGALALKVYSMPVDTLHPEQFFGPKGAMSPEFVWADWYMLIASVLLWGPLAYLFAFLWKRYKENKPIIRKVKVERKMPAHQKALEAIDRINNEKIWKKGLAKEYYTQLTDALRSYIEDRFGFNAMEMTSSDIIEHLHKSSDVDALDELRELLQTADLVKFAKLTPLMSESDIHLLNAVKFVNETRQIELVQNAEPLEETILEKRSLKAKLMIGAGMLAIAAFIVGSLVYVLTELFIYL